MYKMMRKSPRDDKKDKKRKSASANRIFRKRYCRFCKDHIETIDYKNLETLEKLISERGKILSRRFTGTCARHQRKVASAIKRARFIAILPYLR